MYNLRILWRNGEIPEEPLNMFAVDAPIECAMYAVEKNLLGTKGWTRFQKYAKRNGLLEETDEHNGDENNNWLFVLVILILLTHCMTSSYMMHVVRSYAVPVVRSI